MWTPEINTAVNEADKSPCSHGIYSLIGKRQIYKQLYTIYKSSVGKCYEVEKQAKGIESDCEKVIFYTRLSEGLSEK